MQSGLKYSRQLSTKQLTNGDNVSRLASKQSNAILNICCTNGLKFHDLL